VILRRSLQDGVVVLCVEGTDALDTACAAAFKHAAVEAIPDGGEPGSEWALPEAIGSIVERGLARVRVIRAGHGWLGVTYASDRDFVRERLKAVG